MFQFNSGLNFTTKVPYQFARAHVRDAPNHFVSFTIELKTIKEIYRCTISTPLAQSFPKSEDFYCARALHVHLAP